MMKKLGAMILAGTLMASLMLTGCGGSSSASSAASSEAPAAEEQKEEAAEEPAAEEPAAEATEGTITVGVVNNPPSESGYREANVKDMEAVFSPENGYALKTFYSLKNDEQLSENSLPRKEEE